MADRLTLVKRKGVEQDWDYSDLRLSSPARKIRRLDADVVLDINTGDEAVPLVVEQQLPTDQIIGGTTEEFPSTEESMFKPSPNEERSLVLYRPIDDPYVMSPSSLTVNSDFITALKGQSYWQDRKKLLDDKVGVSNNCMAVVPWIPSPTLTSSNEVEGFLSAGAPVEEVMEGESSSMDVEEDMEQTGTGLKMGSKGFQQWQQHCLTSQLQPKASTTPITWSR